LKDYLVISTGGTVASGFGEEGIHPVLGGNELLRSIPGLDDFKSGCEILDLMSKDSSNMVPDDWVAIAETIRSNEKSFRSFIVLHGTDTMAYTASALSFMLCDFHKPVVLTGSMKTAAEPDSDVSDNILSAFLFADELIVEEQVGVSVSFAGKLIHGPRSKKVVSREKTAFESINYPLLGSCEDGKALILHRPVLSCPASFAGTGFPIDKNIVLLKIYPGFQASFLKNVLEMHPHAIVLESLGLGGVPYIGENLLPALDLAGKMRIPIVVTTQCVYGGVDLSVYEVGRKTLDLGVISGVDMTVEAIITKLMLLLPRYSFSMLKKIFHDPFCDEVNVAKHV